MKTNILFRALIAGALTAGPAAFSLQAALKDGLVVHLPFDASFNDISGKANHGTAVGTPLLNPGQLGKAVFVANALDGSSADYVTLGTVPDVLFGDSTDFTVSMWVQLNEFAGDPAFFSNKNWNSGSNRGYVLATGGDRRVQWNFKEADYSRRDFDSSGNLLPSGEWHHLAMTVARTGNIITYLDGVQINSSAARLDPAGAPSSVDTDDLELAVNIGNDGTGTYTDGGSVRHGGTGIDDVAIWRRALTASEVFRIFDNGKKGLNVSQIPEPTTAAIDSAQPGADAKNVSPAVVVTVAIKDAATTVVPADVSLKFDDAAVSASVVKNGDVTTLTFDPPGLLAAGSTHSYEVTFKDSANNTKTQKNSFTVKTYVNVVLTAPFAAENFDSVAEGALPTGWTVFNYTTPINPGIDLDDFRSDAYADWVVIDVTRMPTLIAGGASDADIGNVAPDQFINGQPVTKLLNNRFVLGQSTDRSGGQIQYLTTKDYDCTGKTDVFLVVNSAHKANQDSLFAIEYSTDGGTTWQPALYALDTPDVAKDGTGAVDAVATFNNAQTDLPSYTDPVTSEEKGGSYGVFIGAPITPALAPFISQRSNDDGTESKRVEIIRLAGADNKAGVRVRFINVGTDSWYSAIDDFALHTITTVEPPKISADPAAVSVIKGLTASFSVTASGVGVTYQWKRGGSPIPNATQATYTITTVTDADQGSYTVTVTNAGGSVTSAPAVLTVLPSRTLAQDLVAHLPFEDNLTDNSGAGHHGTAVGSVSYVAGKVGGKALQYSSNKDGSSFNYVTLGSAVADFGTTDFAVSFWAKISNWTGDPAFIGNKDWNSGGNQGWVVATAGDGRIQWNIADVDRTRKDYDSPGGKFNDGNWHHIVVSFQRSADGVTYFDGVELNRTSLNPNLDVVGTAVGKALNIGQDGTGTYTDGGSVGIADGNIDDVAIWTRALTAAEAAAIYAKGQGGESVIPVSSLKVSSATVSGDNLVLNWTGGTGPFLVQGKLGLSDPNWLDLQTVSGNTASIPTASPIGFFRVVDGATKTVKLFKATLNSAQEVATPPVVSPASGVGLLALDGTTVTYVVSYENLLGTIAAAHLHGPAGAGANAGVKIGFVVVTGTKSGVIAGQATADAATVAAIEGGNTYFNVHTTSFGGGEIRGQVTPVQ